MHSELSRVTESIGSLVIEFCENRLRNNPVFHAKELVGFVLSRRPATAPNSPTRILQCLRLEGHLNYELLDRRKSEYRALPMPEAT
jgi:hypothetical protein